MDNFSCKTVNKLLVFMIPIYAKYAMHIPVSQMLSLAISFLYREEKLSDGQKTDPQLR
jgi:hypothetical protein